VNLPEVLSLDESKRTVSGDACAGSSVNDFVSSPIVPEQIVGCQKSVGDQRSNKRKAAAPEKGPGKKVKRKKYHGVSSSATEIFSECDLNYLFIY